MRIPPPDYSQRRGNRSLFIWASVPFWMVLEDSEADALHALCSGGSPPAGRAGDPLPARLLDRVRRGGVIGRRRKAPPDRIEWITVNITNRCPLECSFCYNQAREFGPDELPAAEMIQALESVRRWVIPGAPLLLTGGEPLLGKEKTLALARWGRRRRLRPVVSTNGLLVDEEFARSAAALGLECQVSLDGSRRESHEGIRGAGTFDGVLAGVRALVGAGAHVILSMVLHRGNALELVPYLHLARALGAREARFVPVRQTGNAGGYRAPDLALVVREMAGLLRTEPELAGLLGRDYVSLLADTCAACLPRQSCQAGARTLLLDADGTVYPCSHLANPEMAAGDVRRESLALIWRTADGLARVRRETRIEERCRACTACAVRHWCLGGCRGEAYESTGRLDAPSVTCPTNCEAIMEMLWALADTPELHRPVVRYC